MFITPMPPSASVTMPTMVKNCFMRPIIRPNISVWSDVSHIAIACLSAGSKPWRRARIARTFCSSGQSMSSIRPVRSSSARGSWSTTQSFGATMMSDSVPGSASRARQVARHRGERHEDLVVVGPAVVAVLVLLADLADHGVRQAVQRDRLAEDVALAEQLLGHVEADDGDARHLLLVLPGEVAAVFELDGADVLILRLDAGDLRGGGVVGALHLHGAARRAPG